MLADLKSIVSEAAERTYAVAAFNVFGYEDAAAVVRAAEQLNAPVILAANVPAIRHMPVYCLGPLLHRIAEKAAVPVCVHLDHGSDFETIMQAVQHGFTSVMYDGSQLPFGKMRAGRKKSRERRTPSAYRSKPRSARSGTATLPST